MWTKLSQFMKILVSVLTLSVAGFASRTDQNQCHQFRPLSADETRQHGVFPTTEQSWVVLPPVHGQTPIFCPHTAANTAMVLSRNNDLHCFYVVAVSRDGP